MKTIFVFLFLVVLLACTSASAEDSNGLNITEELNTEELQDFASMMAYFAGSKGTLTDSPGPEPYRRCVRIRCPIKCIICICKCIKWA